MGVKDGYRNNRSLFRKGVYGEEKGISPDGVSTPGSGTLLHFLIQFLQQLFEVIP